MPAKPARGYDEQDLHNLMNHVGEWARSWDDVLRYLQSPRDNEPAIPPATIHAMMNDIADLQEQQARYTRDYRKIWQRITGAPGECLPPPEKADPSAMDPFEIEVDYFGDLEFPADKRQLIRAARLSGAPGRVMERIEALDKADYRNRDELLEELNDADWSTSQQPERARIPGGGRS